LRPVRHKKLEVEEPQKEAPPLGHKFSSSRDKLNRHFLFLLLFFIVILGSALRIYGLSYKSMWADEVWSIELSGKNIPEVIRDSFLRDRHPPLYYIMLHFFLYFGDSEFVARLPSVIFGVLSIWLIYKVGRLFFGKREGLISAFLLSISTMHIHYSQEARMYSLFILLALFSLFLFYKAVKENSRKLWIGFMLSTMLGILSHYYMLFIPLIEGIFFVFMLISNRSSFFMGMKKVIKRKLYYPTPRDKKETLLFILGLVVISIFLKYVLDLLKTGILFSPWGLKPSSFFEELFSRFGADDFGFLFFSLRMDAGFLYNFFKVSFLFLLTFLLGLVTSIIDYREQSILLLLWVFFPTITVFVLTLSLGSSITVPHYMIFILPGYIIGVSKGISSIAKGLSKCCYKIIHGLSPFPLSVSISSIALVITLIFAGLSTIPLQEYYSDKRVDWRGAGEYLEANSHPGDVIIVEPTYQQHCLLYYYDAYLKKTRVISTELSLVEIKDTCSKYDRVWFVLHYDAKDEIRNWVHHNFIEANIFGGSWGLIFIFYRTNELIFISTKEMDFVGLDSPPEPVAEFWHNDDSATFNVNISKAANYTMLIHAKSWIKSALELVIDGKSKGIVTFTADDWSYIELVTFYFDSGSHEIKLVNREGGDLGDTNVVFDKVIIRPA